MKEENQQVNEGVLSTSQGSWVISPQRGTWLPNTSPCHARAVKPAIWPLVIPVTMLCAREKRVGRSNTAKTGVLWSVGTGSPRRLTFLYRSLRHLSQRQDLHQARTRQQYHLRNVAIFRSIYRPYPIDCQVYTTAPRPPAEDEDRPPTTIWYIPPLTRLRW